MKDLNFKIILSGVGAFLVFYAVCAIVICVGTTFIKG